MNEKWIFGSVCTKKEKGFCRPKFAGIAAALPTTECTRDQRNINQSYLNADLFSAALLLVLYLQHLWIGQREEKNYYETYEDLSSEEDAAFFILQGFATTILKDSCIYLTDELLCANTYF